MTSAQELAQNIGKTATLRVAGDGEAWHQSTAVIFDSEHTFDEQVFGSGLTTGQG
jgi:hypothetical protein